MSPEERKKFDQMYDEFKKLKSVEDVQFIESIKTRLRGAFFNTENPPKLSELSDVDTAGVTNGQVIKYNSTSGEWEPANDIDT